MFIKILTKSISKNYRETARRNAFIITSNYTIMNKGMGLMLLGIGVAFVGVVVYTVFYINVLFK